MNHPVLFSFSGHRQSGKTSIYQEVRRLFQEHHPEQPLLFLGNVLGDLGPAEEATCHATTLLLEGWARLNEACVSHIRPALLAGRSVVVDESGLDVYLRAVTCQDCPQQKVEAYELHHHHLVPARIVTQGIRPPTYLLPRKRRSSSATVAVLQTREEIEIERYFDNTGQNAPLWLDSETVAEQAMEAMEHILAISALRETVSA